MKIEKVVANARKKEFILKVDDRQYTFPYARLRLVPTPDDQVAEVYPDPELGNEAFTYRLESGAEDTIPVDAVREVNLDPDYITELLLHRLTVDARAGLEHSGLGKRQVARLMGTSPAQLYRLVDPDNSTKSFRQLIHLLHLLGFKVEMNIVRREDTAALKPDDP